MVRWPMVVPPGQHRTMNPDEQSTDPHRRPIVLQSEPTDGESAGRKPRRYFAWAGTGVIALAAATGIVAGGTAVWSAVDPGRPANSPAPLWTSTPENVAPQAAFVSPSPDDHGDRRLGTPGSPTAPREPGDDKGGLRKPGTVEPGDDKGGLRRPSSGGTTEPGDDKGGLRTPGTIEPGDDKGGLRNPTTRRTTEPGDDKGGLRAPGTIEPGDDKGGLRNPTSGRTTESGDDKGGHGGSDDRGGDDKGGSGKSSDDPAGHH